ncbi:MAG TPA: Uma2 family endonuclease [Streptosporangiaceae bacterium]|nr:Uma2 family endonuclease [Streptosporangiaceae bacterium]
MVSPDDESWAKLDFYAAHEVDEVLIVDPQARQVTWLARDDTTYAEAEGSTLLGISTAELASRIDWPPVS